MLPDSTPSTGKKKPVVMARWEMKAERGAVQDSKSASFRRMEVSIVTCRLSPGALLVGYISLMQETETR